jgi:3-oxoacyl-[acyl-carrier-protein] synthase-1/3-oxoacyl-[acyl-carrier-protein] synthase II
MDNDRVESRVLHEMMPGVPFFSTKAHTGHTLGAAGAIQAIFTIACLEKKHIPKSAGFRTPDPDLCSIPNDCDQPTSSGIALSESLAFGGNNSVLIFQKE